MAGLMRNLGRFVGEIGRAIRSPVPAEQGTKRSAKRTSVATESHRTPQGRVTLTRTTVEEIRVEPDDRVGSEYSGDDAEGGRGGP